MKTRRIFEVPTRSLLFLSWEPQVILSFYQLFTLSFMRTAGYLRFYQLFYPFLWEPQVIWSFYQLFYHFFHENRRLFEASTSCFYHFFDDNRRLYEASTSSLPFLSWKPQAIWSFYQLFPISFTRTAGYLKFLPAVCHFFHENHRSSEIFEMIRTSSCYCELFHKTTRGTVVSSSSEIPDMGLKFLTF
jgi:hypothetical protein